MWHFLRSLVLVSLCLSPSQSLAGITNGQGEQAGEVTSTSVILQSRLTNGRTLVEDDLPGMAGFARFEVSTDDAFADSTSTRILTATADHDFIVKTKVSGLELGTRYFYRVHFGTDKDRLDQTGATRSFRTNAPASSDPVSLVVVTGMNYWKYHSQTPGADKTIGYPGLVSMAALKPDYFVGTGDNVYYDSPRTLGGSKRKLTHEFARTQQQLRQKWHVQFCQQRFIDLFSDVGVYWEKDDHDHRTNDCDTQGDYLPSNRLGIDTFKEQVPITDPADPDAKTYRSHRLSKHLQIWLPEGRDYRSANNSPDGPDKVMWGKEQVAWMKKTLRRSDATWRVIISPTPLIGPDDAYKRDNHTNINGFQHEGDAFKQWLIDKGLDNNTYFVCGDRHWQYHSIAPNGLEEFSCGALVDANARAGRLPGDRKSTDPDATIQQPYVQTPKTVSGGFLRIVAEEKDAVPEIRFEFYDEQGAPLYSHMPATLEP